MRKSPILRPCSPLKSSQQSHRNVQNFAVKYGIDRHIEAKKAAKASRKQTHVILRPVSFLEIHHRGYARTRVRVHAEHMGTKTPVQPSPFRQPEEKHRIAALVLW